MISSSMLMLNSIEMAAHATAFIIGVYLVVIGWYVVVFVAERRHERQSFFATPLGLWAVPLGASTLVSISLGYWNTGLLLASVVGVAPGIAFGTVGTVLRMRNLNDPDTSVWTFVVPLWAAGTLFAVVGFALGSVIR